MYCLGEACLTHREYWAREGHPVYGGIDVKTMATPAFKSLSECLGL